MPKNLTMCSSLRELDLRDNPDLPGVPNYLLRDEAVTGAPQPCSCHCIGKMKQLSVSRCCCCTTDRVFAKVEEQGDRE